MSGPLYVRDEAGEFSPALDAHMIEAGVSAARRKLRRGRTFDSPKVAREFLPALLGAREAEVFCIAHLDNRHRLIAFEELFQGTIDGASVHPRELLRAVMRHNSAAVILVHNHPSGTPEPSHADEVITRRIRELLALIDVRVLDHFIVAGDTTCSMAARGDL